MGFFNRHVEQKHQQQHTDWEQEVAAVRDMVEVAHDWPGEPITSDSGLIGKPGERAYAILQGAALIEPRRLPGHWNGHNQGVSFPIYKGIRYRVGATKGTYQQGEERPTPIDSGVALISDQRVVFAGEKATREWLYSKLIGFHHDEHLPWTAIQVSNRQKVSGILYTEQTITLVRFRFELALAVYGDTREAFAASMERQLNELIAEKPITLAGTEVSGPTVPRTSQPQSDAIPCLPVPGPAAVQPEAIPAAAPLPPANWYPNPDAPGLRYWNGAAWTQDFAPPEGGHPGPLR